MSTKSRSPRKRSHLTKRAQSLPLIHPDAAAVDVGANLMYAAVPIDRSQTPARCFDAFTENLHELADWFVECGVKTVAMESTGVYWIPLYQILESRGFTVCLVNARHLYNVPGKTDVSDCQWIQYLHAVGLLRPSFRPEDQVCVLRAYFRHRSNVVRQAASQINLMQKALTQMNILIHNVLSDITGKTGMAIMRAILDGERDPRALAEHRDPRVKASEATIIKSLQGDWREEHLFALRQALETYRHFQQQMANCDKQIEACLVKFGSKADPSALPAAPPGRKKPQGNELRMPTIDLREELYRIIGTDLTAIPSLNETTIHTILAELGAQFTNSFPTVGHFVSWLGVCPNNRITGGNVKSRHTKKNAQRVAVSLRVAAQSLHSSKSALGEYYRRMRTRLGAPKALTAAANKLARIIYQLVKTGQAYDESIFQRNEEQYVKRRARRIEKEANQLGFKLVPKT